MRNDHLLSIPLFLVLAACISFDPGGNPDADCDAWTFVPGNFDPCQIAITSVGDDLTLSKPGIYLFDTDTDSLQDPDGMTVPVSQQSRVQGSDVPEIELVLVKSLVIAAGTLLRVEGTRPLLIASWGDITIDGAIDVSSGKNPAAKPGAGADSQACAGQGATPGQDGSEGGGGGGGGGFGREGGSGGSTTNPSAGGGGSGGQQLDSLTTLRGGCPGAKGGKDVDENDGAGQGGQGGGAIQLAARGKLTINGTIDAAGEGGRGANCSSGTNSSGGGGGGSGGLIQLEGDAIIIQTSAILAANGGGGGGGCGLGIGIDGDNGLLDTQAASGGPGEGGRSDGGSGGFVDLTDGQPGESDPDRGGGGGGGGVGFIVLHSPNGVSIQFGAKFSPIPTTPPGKSAR